MKTTSVFQSGNSQAVRLPKTFRFDEERLYIRRLGDAVVLLPYKAPWNVLRQSLDKFSPDFMAEGREQSEQAEREHLFE